ncbi:uncharacterized protein LOC122656507 isoform X4 [Telopea speciosissima]|uniref:uncharacterized protein LOC122656507 isoform X4 n=1 Tax=Telopea speciosissima TaxID=54955 RepID=UPI001CC472FE|nr:uncharacterized protein LOC122656507 isoform X4 [Telopea speciosissima]
MLALGVGLTPPIQFSRKCRSSRGGFGVWADGFPSFLPKEVEEIKDPFARKLAKRIERLPVQLQVGMSEKCIMSSCVKPLLETEKNPVVLLHGFDSSCLEWRYAYPLLEEAGLETWAVDILGWGFSDLERLPSCDVGHVASKRNHLCQVKQLVLIDASVYTKGTGDQTKLPRIVSYAGVSLLKSIPLRMYATLLCFNNISFTTSLDWTKVGRLHCLLPWWKDATVGFMNTGGYDVISLIEQVKQETLIIWGEDDQIISSKLAVRLQCELPNAIVRQIPDCGHIPHVEKPDPVAKLIVDFIRGSSC